MLLVRCSKRRHYSVSGMERCSFRPFVSTSPPPFSLARAQAFKKGVHFHVPPTPLPSLPPLRAQAHKKGIRRATVNTFGYIAKAIGPQDVLATLLNNLKVQERQNRVCTTVAIAIVAETCAPFTVLPALMNEYRVPELNVQNGVLKSLSFMFEYIGEMGKDYIYAVTPLLEDALIDRDLVHRQTAATTVMHLALGTAGLGCEDSLLHLLNYIWPNIFEQSPHVVNAVSGAIDGMRVALGPSTVLYYLLQGLFHPARKVSPACTRGGGGGVPLSAHVACPSLPLFSLALLHPRSKPLLPPRLPPPRRCARRTGSCTTTSISARRTRWWPSTPSWRTWAPTRTTATSWRCSSEGDTYRVTRVCARARAFKKR